MGLGRMAYMVARTTESEDRGHSEWLCTAPAPETREEGTAGERCVGSCAYTLRGWNRTPHGIPVDPAEDAPKHPKDARPAGEKPSMVHGGGKNHAYRQDCDLVR